MKDHAVVLERFSLVRKIVPKYCTIVAKAHVFCTRSAAVDAKNWLT
jgi:hypothetical protein